MYIDEIILRKYRIRVFYKEYSLLWNSSSSFQCEFVIDPIQTTLNIQELVISYISRDSPNCPAGVIAVL